MMMQKADITELNPAQLQICDAIERELPKMSRKQTARILASLKEIMSRGSERFEISRALKSFSRAAQASRDGAKFARQQGSSRPTSISPAG
jgi:hypothetical protein